MINTCKSTQRHIHSPTLQVEGVNYSETSVRFCVLPRHMTSGRSFSPFRSLPVVLFSVFCFISLVQAIVFDTLSDVLLYFLFIIVFAILLFFIYLCDCLGLPHHS